jgi:hypothetical protein
MRKPIWQLREGLRLWMWSRQRDNCGDGPFFGYPKRPLGPAPSDLRMRLRKLLTR